MNSRFAVLLTILLAFLAYTVWVAVARDPPLLAYLSALPARGWNTQILLDLAISLAIVCTWLIRDARNRGRRAWPWVAATPVFGSLAPLLYLLLRERDRPQPS
jgi:hypothetical protein